MVLEQNIVVDTYGRYGSDTVKAVIEARVRYSLDKEPRGGHDLVVTIEGDNILIRDSEGLVRSVEG